MREIPILLLAGGLGTRISSIYKDTQKCMIDIHGKPFIWYVLRNIRQFGFTKIIMLVGHHCEQVIDYVGNGEDFGLQVTYSHDGDALLGTGGATKKALQHVENDFIVTYADSYLEHDWSDVVKHYRAIGSKSMVTVYKNIDGSDTSNIVFSNGKVLDYTKINQTKEHQHIDWGVSIFSKDTFANYPESSWDLSRYLSDRIKAGELDGYEISERYYEIGTPESLEALKLHLKKPAQAVQ